MRTSSPSPDALQLPAAFSSGIAAGQLVRSLCLAIFGVDDALASNASSAYRL